jgi:hypothetical protein
MTLMFALRDEETQKRGVVGIAYNVGRGHTKDREAVWRAAKIVSILPVRFTAVHYCFDDEKIRLLFSLAMFVFNKNARIRCRIHFGTHMECIYNLVSSCRGAPFFQTLLLLLFYDEGPLTCYCIIVLVCILTFWYVFCFN